MEICYICKDSLNNDFVSITESHIDMLQVILPQFNLEECISNICSTCDKSIKEIFNFKSFCLEFEDNIYNYKTTNEEKINLEKIIGLDTINQDGKVCRTCGNITSEDLFEEINNEKNNLLQIQQEVCISELNLSLTQHPVMCLSCIQMLRHYYKFVETCTKHKINSISEMKEIIREDHETDVSSNTDNNIKTEIDIVEHAVVAYDENKIVVSSISSNATEKRVHNDPNQLAEEKSTPQVVSEIPSDIDNIRHSIINNENHIEEVQVPNPKITDNNSITETDNRLTSSENQIKKRQVCDPNLTDNNNIAETEDFNLSSESSDFTNFKKRKRRSEVNSISTDQDNSTDSEISSNSKLIDTSNDHNNETTTGRKFRRTRRRIIDLGPESDNEKEDKDFNPSSISDNSSDDSDGYYKTENSARKKPRTRTYYFCPHCPYKDLKKNSTEQHKRICQNRILFEEVQRLREQVNNLENKRNTNRSLEDKFQNSLGNSNRPYVEKSSCYNNNLQISLKPGERAKNLLSTKELSVTTNCVTQPHSLLNTSTAKEGKTGEHTVLNNQYIQANITNSTINYTQVYPYTPYTQVLPNLSIIPLPTTSVNVLVLSNTQQSPYFNSSTNPSFSTITPNSSHFFKNIQQNNLSNTSNVNMIESLPSKSKLRNVKNYSIHISDNLDTSIKPQQNLSREKFNNITAVTTDNNKNLILSKENSNPQKSHANLEISKVVFDLEQVLTDSRNNIAARECIIDLTNVEENRLLDTTKNIETVLLNNKTVTKTAQQKDSLKENDSTLNNNSQNYNLDIKTISDKIITESLAKNNISKSPSINSNKIVLFENINNTPITTSNNYSTSSNSSLLQPCAINTDTTSTKHFESPIIQSSYEIRKTLKDNIEKTNSKSDITESNDNLTKVPNNESRENFHEGINTNSSSSTSTHERVTYTNSELLTTESTNVITPSLVSVTSPSTSTEVTLTSVVPNVTCSSSIVSSASSTVTETSNSPSFSNVSVLSVPKSDIPIISETNDVSKSAIIDITDDLSDDDKSTLKVKHINSNKSKQSNPPDGRVMILNNHLGDSRQLAIFKCVWCPFNTRYYQLVDIHIRTHLVRYLKDSLFTCPQCCSEIKDNELFNQHLQQQHGQLGFKLCFWCVNCASFFTNLPNLIKHFKNCPKKHVSVKLFKSNNVFYCMLCTYETTSKDNIVKHSRSCNARKIKRIETIELE